MSHGNKYAPKLKSMSDGEWHEVGSWAFFFSKGLAGFFKLYAMYIHVPFDMQ